MPLEDILEKKFVKWCQDRELEAIKVSIVKGFPDRTVALGGYGGTIYVEFKGSSLYYDLTPTQLEWKRMLQASNPNRYFVVDTTERLDKLLQWCEALIRIGPQVVAFEKELLGKVLP